MSASEKWRRKRLMEAENLHCIVHEALLGLSAFFSMADTSITTLWPWKVHELAQKDMLDIGATALVTEAATAIFGKAGVSAAARKIVITLKLKCDKCQSKAMKIAAVADGRLFSIVGEENSLKRAEAVIHAEYPNIGKNRLNRDYKDTYVAIEVSEDFLFYANGVRNFKDYLGNSFVFIR
ncbi:hypothetical protein EZV62_008693 [Acer yangbiense]|uniref:HMA domain-containing protein n=1 Tax=Acer yangbiense TaxID=1000413 RepID=A0A5C7IEC8_9ROSI|nr:hypothetical protein EZV62_008693 [Acer yangbiense]